MEDKSIATDAIESAKRWLSSSSANAERGNYDLEVYSLEMSIEIALKALVFSTGTDVPKTHSIGDRVTKIVRVWPATVKQYEVLNKFVFL